MKTEKIQGYVLIAIIVGAILVLTTIPYTPANSIYNENWNGVSDLRFELETNYNFTIERILVSPIILNSDPDIDVMVIIGSDRKYTLAEQIAYRNFVEKGGALILFEDFGPAREIASQFGISYLEGVIRETQPSFYKNRPSQILIQDILASQLYPDANLPPLIGGEVAAVIDASWLSTGQSLERSQTFPLLASYQTAFLDVNNNNKQETTDQYFPYGTPIGLYKSLGNGSVVVIGDASIPLNQYWGLQDTLVNPITAEYTQITYANAFWTQLLMLFVANQHNASKIVFDESHQAVSFTSAAGIFNLIAGTWVGLINTTLVSISILLISGLVTSLNVRSRITNRLRRRRDQGKILNLENHQFISHPTLAERQISEQFILYNIMGDNYIHIANSHLIAQIKTIRNGDEFLKGLEAEYGKDFRLPNTFDELLILHQKLQSFVEDNKNRLL